MTQYERMSNGLICDPTDAEIMEKQPPPFCRTGKRVRY